MQFKNFIQHDFRYNLYLDGLPAAVRIRDPLTGEPSIGYGEGIPVGYFDELESRSVLYNHLHIEVQYNKASERKQNIVGFVVEPRSIQSDALIQWEFFPETPVQPMQQGIDIKYSYSYETKVSVILLLAGKLTH